MKQLPLLLAVLLGAAVSAQSVRSAQRHHTRVVASKPAQRSVVARSAVGHGRPVATRRSFGSSLSRVVVAGAVRGFVDRCAPRSYGRWVTRCEQVLVPGYWDERHVPAVYGWVVDACGRSRWGVVRPASCERFWVPARYETQRRRVWVRY